MTILLICIQTLLNFIGPLVIREILNNVEINKEGITLGEMSIMQMEKIEELTLYIIELNKKLNNWRYHAGIR